MLEFHYTQCEMKEKEGTRHSKASASHYQRVPCGRSNPDKQSMDLYGAVVPKHLTLFTGDSPDTTLSRDNRQ